MVIVAFPPGEKYAVNYTTLDQYDYGQILRIQGLKLPKTVEVHFSIQETGGTSITRVGVTKDGVTDVLIPDSVLENGDTAQNYSIFAFVYVTDATSGKTEYRAKLEVKARPKPEVPGGGDNPDIFHEAVLEVRKSAEKAEEAQKQAEGWAHGREDLPERAEDNAMYYAGKTSEDAKKTAQDRVEVERLTESNTQMQGEVAKDLEEVKNLSSQAQISATNAALSEQKSEEAATRAETAQTGAETAEDNAELAAQKTGQDKTAVEQAKKLVQQMGQEVLENKNLVNETTQDFTLKAQQALADVNNAGQTQTERVQSAGTTAVENIENAQNTATQAVETTKTEAIKAVQTEGITQTGNVTAEGEKQVQAVQTAAQEIIADREQITKNATDIADLRQKKADAIVESVSGTLLNVKDSSGAFFEDFSMSGKTTQDGTPTPDAPVPIVNAGEDGTIEIKVTGKNLIPFPYPLLGGVGAKGANNGITWEVLKDRGIKISGAATGYVYVDLLINEKLQDKNKYAYSKDLLTDSRNGKVFYAPYATETIDELYYPQVEHGANATAYEPYRQPQTITLQLNHPLTKWDKLEKREGVWGIARNGDRKILDGTEIWYRYTLYENDRLYCYCAEGIKSEIGYQKSYCTHFKNENSVWLSQKGKYGEYSDHETLSNKYFISDKPTVEEFKAWLTQQEEAGTPVELVYKTAEETWEPLPEEMQSVLNALHTNYPTTVVSNSEDVNMQLTYVADTKNYYLNREQTIQKQILEIQNALISQKIRGGGIKVTNSAKLPVVKLAVFGKSKQVTTTGANIFNANSVKSYTEGSMEIRNNKNGTITFKGTNNSEFPTNYNLDKNGKIVLSAGYWTVSVDGLEKCSLVIQTKDNKIFKELKSGSFTFNNPVEQGLTFFLIQCKAGETVEETVSVYLEKGNNALKEPYTGGKPSPSLEYPQEITSCGENGNVKIDVTGKNLLNIEGETSEIRGDYEIFDNKITTITKDGYAGSYLMFSEKIPKGKYRFTCNKTKKGVKQNNKVLLSVKAKTDESSAGNSFNSYYKEWLIVEYLKKDILFETFEDFQIGLPLAGDDDKIGDEIIFENVMLIREDLDLTSAYEPYKKIQTFALYTPNGLLGLKAETGGNYTDETGQQWIADEIDLARGKYVQRIGKRILDGSEALADNIGSSTSYFLKVNDARSNTGMCNYGKRIPITGQKQEELTFSVDDSGIYLYTTKAVNEFKNLLKQKYDSGKPVEVLYALKTPIETDLPPETIAAFKQLHTNHHTTIITNNADAGIELTYTVDTQSYIDGKIATLSKAML